MSLDLNLLRILLAVYETKNAGAVAHRLGMSQPGLSGALKRARIALGDPLFLRTVGGMEPTARTRELIVPIRDILATIDSKVIAPARFVPGKSTSEFCIALSDIGESVYLPSIVRCLAEQASNATIRSVSLKPKELEEAMEQGKVDLAIGYFPDFKSDDIFEQAIGTNSFCRIANIEHPLRDPRLTLGQFQSVGHAVVETEGRSQELFEQFLRAKKKNVVDPYHVQVLHSTFSGVQFADGFSLMPKVDFVYAGHGVVYHAYREFEDGRKLKRINSALLPNVSVIPSVDLEPGRGTMIGWHVPVDETTVRVFLQRSAPYPVVSQGFACTTGSFVSISCCWPIATRPQRGDILRKRSISTVHPTL
jgi:DNA-binding transcriptional LysR family regulator